MLTIYVAAKFITHINAKQKIYDTALRHVELYGLTNQGIVYICVSTACKLWETFKQPKPNEDGTIGYYAVNLLEYQANQEQGITKFTKQNDSEQWIQDNSFGIDSLKSGVKKKNIKNCFMSRGFCES